MRTCTSSINFQVVFDIYCRIRFQLHTLGGRDDVDNVGQIATGFAHQDQYRYKPGLGLQRSDSVEPTSQRSSKDQKTTQASHERRKSLSKVTEHVATNGNIIIPDSVGSLENPAGNTQPTQTVDPKMLGPVDRVIVDSQETVSQSQKVIDPLTKRYSPHSHQSPKPNGVIADPKELTSHPSSNIAEPMNEQFEIESQADEQLRYSGDALKNLTSRFKKTKITPSQDRMSCECGNKDDDNEPVVCLTIYPCHLAPLLTTHIRYAATSATAGSTCIVTALPAMKILESLISMRATNA